jgi:hypothetical protein
LLPYHCDGIKDAAWGTLLGPAIWLWLISLGSVAAAAIGPPHPSGSRTG